MKYIAILMAISISLFISACRNTHSLHEEEKITVAKAQKEIKLGMSSSAVVEALGSPNMVTTDSQRRETWVYDKISTQVSSSRSETGVWFLIFGSASTNKQKSSNQRTLTIIVKFDEKSNVRDFSYRTSSF